MQLNLIKIDRDFDPNKVITNPKAVDEKTNKFNNDGIFSEAIFGKMSSSTNEYSCVCGDMNGKFFKGLTCKVCNTEVELRTSNFDKKGWVYFNGYKAINPLFFNFFAKIIGKTQFERILDFNIKTDIDGNPIYEDNKDYTNSGMCFFIDNWSEILDYYAEKKIKKDETILDLYNLIIENQNSIFIEAFPIFTASLRPAVLTSKHISFAEVNTSYNFMIAESNALNNLNNVTSDEYNVNHILNRIQKHTIEVFDYVLTSIGGKGKYLRSSVFGTRVNFSARCVITPNDSHKSINEVALPYLTFMEMFKFEILNIHSKIKNCTLIQSYNEWSKAQSNFSELFYSIIQEMLKKAKEKFGISGMPILINRNPTLHLGSMLRVTISEVKKDINDLTMSLSNLILSPIGGDFDG